MKKMYPAENLGYQNNKNRFGFIMYPVNDFLWGKLFSGNYARLDPEGPGAVPTPLPLK
jgi:hypothetical protein